MTLSTQLVTDLTASRVYSFASWPNPSVPSFGAGVYTIVVLLPDAPSIDANEITDKGYINQRLALERRKADVARLFAAKPEADVIVVTPSAP